MTEQRSLKKIVRDRMLRTGESYTTAHRHVSAHATPQSVPGLTPGYPGFGSHAHGPSGLARHLLAQAGIDVSEAVACGLGGGIGFLYAVFEYTDVPYPILTIVAQHHPQPWLEAVAGHLGIELSTVTSSKPGPALAKLDATLDAGKAAQLTVGRGLLPWHPSTRPEEAADAHAIVIAGKHDNDYVIDDGDGEHHRLSSEPLAVAWAAHRKGRFGITTLEPLATAPDLSAGIRAAIATTHAHLTGPVLGNYFDVNMGLRGMVRFVDDLANTSTKRGWTQRFASPLALENATRRLAECLTWAHTATGATRPLYSTFLAEAGSLAGLELELASETAAEAGRGWTALADLAGVTTAQDDAQETIAAFAELAAQILPIEERLSRLLGATIGSTDSS